MSKQEAWTSDDNAAKHLGLAKDTVNRWIASKGMPAGKVGRPWKFKPSQVGACVKASGASADESKGKT